MYHTSCLYDKGEENWPLKLHLCCGGIYLSGYANCDIDGILASDDPQVASYNLTTVDDYYARLEGDVDHLPKRRPTVVDARLDMSILPYINNSVDKILCIQAFEHLTPIAAIETIDVWRRVMKRGQPLVMSVPDTRGTIDMIETNPGFAMRHLRGRGGDSANTHQAWYTYDSLCELLNYVGFRVSLLENFHFYPAIVVRAIKL